MNCIQSRIRVFTLLLLWTSLATSHAQGFLKRSLTEIPATTSELFGAPSTYTAVFGKGDQDDGFLKGVSRYGVLTVPPGLLTTAVKLQGEEQILFILEGTGILEYGDRPYPVSKNDFMYLPPGITYRIHSPGESALIAILMGFSVPDSAAIEIPCHLLMANSEEVEKQVLGSHGPTTLFQLLLGTTKSKRDRLAAALQVNSLFIMEFAPGGTNIPHRHPVEEEIYYVLDGTGEMVTGETAGEKEIRTPAKAGDIFCFQHNTLIGFYSGQPDGAPHSRILAVRSKYPVPAESVLKEE